MARLAREVKKKLAFLDKRRHSSGIANVGKIDSHAIADVVNVKKIAAVFGNQAVHQGHSCVETDQTPGEGGADKAESARNEHVGTGKNLKIHGHERIVGRGQKDF